MPLDVSKVRYISMIRLEGGESIVNVPYAEMTVDPDLIAGFVTAVIIFAKTPIRTIRKAAYDILIEVGETVLILLVVDPVPDETPYRKRLTRILSSLEEKHGGRLKEFEGDVRRYREFTIEILTEFPFFLPDLDLVPVKIKSDAPISYRVGKVDSQLEQVEAFINGKRTVAEIMDLIQLPDEMVTALISILGKHKYIEFKQRLTVDNIRVRLDCSHVIIDRLKAQYGKPLEELIVGFDGIKKIKEILESLPYDGNAMWFLINKLVEVGCLGQIPS